MGRKKNRLKGKIPGVDYVSVNPDTPLGKFIIEVEKGKYKPRVRDKNVPEMILEDSVRFSWSRLAETAKILYDEPKDAHDVLVKGATKKLFKQTDPKTYMLCRMLENERKKKKNKARKFNSIVNENLAACCAYIDIPIEHVYPSKTYMKQNPDWKKDKQFKYAHLDRQPVLSSIIEKHRRLVKYNKKAWNQYLKDGSINF